ncbi:MAG: ABC transporter substrate-binding protein [Acidimicrobiia bacterium]
MTAIAMVAVAGLVAGPVGASAPDRARQQASDGTLLIAAEQELATANWISSSAGSSWGVWSLGVHTLPQAFTVTPEGTYEPSPVLAGEPTLSEGPPQVVTYPINPDAVWSDGTPITSADFEYLWEQISTGKDIYDDTGYRSIESVDTTDPKTAVVTFSEPFAAWKDLFGGFYFLVPSHLLEGKSLDKAMKDGYAFSGGPWKMDGGKKGWKKTKSITLVPNDAYWGTKPSIQKVTFQFIVDSAAETQAVKTGQVLSAYPQPQEGILDEFDESEDLEYVVSFGNVYEGFWLNAGKFPLDSQAVRQALMAATDRTAIVDGIVKPAVREGRVLQSFVMPIFPEYFTAAFADAGYGETADLAKVDELMTGDGWAKNSQGIWEKDGKTASLEIQTTAGNEARELTEELWQSQLQTAGFELEIKNPNSDVLFGVNGPKGKFQVALYAQVGTPDPGLCIVFCATNIPTKKNGFVGQNWTRTDDPTIDETWGAVDVTLDTAARAEAAKAGQAALADYLVAIPLYQKPNVFVWDSAKIDGPLVDNPTLGPFFNMNLWTLNG